MPHNGSESSADCLRKSELCFGSRCASILLLRRTRQKGHQASGPSLGPGQFPQTVIAAFLWAATEGSEREALGQRIVEIPDDLERFESRDHESAMRPLTCLRPLTRASRTPMPRRHFRFRLAPATATRRRHAITANPPAWPAAARQRGRCPKPYLLVCEWCYKRTRIQTLIHERLYREHPAAYDHSQQRGFRRAA